MNKLKEAHLKNRKLSKRIIFFLMLLSIIFGVVTVWGNVTLSVEYIDIGTDKLADSSTGCKIAHISDYHNTKIQSLTDSVISVLKAEKPDIILLTGDIVDCRKTDIVKGIKFVESITKIAPVYYVTGNHECNISIENQSAFDNMLLDLKALGVIVLRNEQTQIQFENGDYINLMGIDDPYFHCTGSNEVKETTDELCSMLTVNKDAYNILLAHHPEQLDVYSEHGFDVVFSGHAHGGQGRLFGLGLIAPDQGLFPEYTSGLYQQADTKLIVSRGIGNSIAPVRIFDRPHLIITEIK